MYLFSSVSPGKACVIEVWCSRTQNGSWADAEIHRRKIAERPDLEDSQRENYEISVCFFVQDVTDM